MAKTFDEAYKVLHRDPIMRRIIKGTGLLKPRRAQKDIYGALLRSITGQQLSVKAAATIHGRFLDLFHENDPNPTRLLRMPIEKLRSAGLSMQKANYLKSVAAQAQQGNLEFKSINQLDDDALVRSLTEIKGIGVWSAQMVMMFALQRPDVFPTGDLGIQQSMAKHYGIQDKGKALIQSMETIADHWRPFRTLACRHLWAIKDL